MNPVQFLSSNLKFNFGGIDFTSQGVRVVAIIVLVFLLILSLAQFRRHFVDWSLKGAVSGLFLGFLMALILEGFLIIGGRTAITEFLGWKNAPQPIQVVVDMGREKLVSVLGIKDQIAESYASSDPTPSDAINILQSLNPDEMKKIKSLICTP